MKNKLCRFIKPYYEIIRPYLKKLLWLLLSAFSTGAVYINSELYALPEKYQDNLLARFLFGRLYFHLRSAVKGIDLFAFLWMAALYFLFSKTPKHRGTKGQRGIAVFFSVLIPFVLLLCKSYAKVKSWDYVFGSEGAVLFTVIKALGYGVILYSLFCFASCHSFRVQSHERLDKPCDFKRELRNYTLLFLVLWIPYMVLLYPGCFSPDAKDQIAQVVGSSYYCWSADAVVLLDENVILNTHHPLFYTGILAFTLQLGQLIHSYVLSFELLCIAQAAAMAFSFAYALAVMKKHGARNIYLMAAAAFFAFNPLFAVYAMTIIKDSFYCAFMVLAVVSTYEMLAMPVISKRRLLCYFGIMMLFILTRNNSVYVLALVLLFVVITQFKDKKRMLKISGVLLACVLIVQIGLAAIIYPAMHVTPGSKREMLSVPFQQTARYIKEYKKEVTPEEKEAILKVLNTGGNLKQIRKAYDPDFADPVKVMYNKYATNEDLADYFRVWFSQLKKHPATYVQAYLNLHYGWFSFEGNPQITYSEIENKHIERLVEGFTQHMGNEAMRDFVNYGQRILMKNPLTAAPLEMATYTWIYIALLIYAVKRKKHKALLANSIVYFNYLICFLGPVAYMRYAVPMACVMPFAVFTVFCDDDDTVRPSLKENYS